ncbi:MAG: glutamyl-tRNA reductase [Propionibacteriaceae bacterium]|nr:glutamyl-tRNA reductase [Propionibacteriaceae bacterium]
MSFSVHHLDHGMAAVQRVTPAADEVAHRLRAEDLVNGVLVLSTCNRFEVYLDVTSAPLGRIEAIVRRCLRSVLASSGCPAHLPQIPLRVRRGEAVMRHMLRVAAGLDSMVVGEREIVGQLRRALKKAAAENLNTRLLNMTAEHALRCSRRVSAATRLADQGRSIVAVGLDLAAESVGAGYSPRVLLIGTGAYAGATVHALRRRGWPRIGVYSRSGRAADFAESHGVDVVEDLPAGLRAADVVVSCSGTGGCVLTESLIAAALAVPRLADLAILDLALRRDVAPEVAGLPGVKLWTLDSIGQVAGELTFAQVEQAENIVDEALDGLLAALRGRQLDPVIVALRDLVAGMVEDEAARLPHGSVPREAAERALRRLAARMIHAPLDRARQAAEQGHSLSYATALGELYDLDVAVTDALGQDLAPLDPGTLECPSCPATGLGLDDLKPTRPHLEAI